MARPPAKVISVSVLLVCLGCGGGGGGADADASFAGVWESVLTVSRNPCDVEDIGLISPTFTVNQDGPAVVVDYPHVATLAGVAGAGGFTARGAIPTDACGGTGRIDLQLDFVRGADGPDRAAVVLRAVSGCPGSVLSCEAVWDGVATRR